MLMSMILMLAATVLTASAMGPLRVHPQNPRYFTDGGKGIWLGGHQIFVDIQDNSFNKEWIKDMRYPDDPDKKLRLLNWDQYLVLSRAWASTMSEAGSSGPAGPGQVHRPIRSLSQCLSNVPGPGMPMMAG